ncbi:MAG: antitoxin family protein [Bryobacteraceae bacterium]|jgi:predicted DNA-binding antitoxin AbrB/MazE fold protein
MMQELEAVYENGVLRPLGPVALAESQTVRIIIATPSGGRSQLDSRMIERARAEVLGAENTPTIEEVRNLLAVIPGSLADDVTAERGEY